MCLPLQEAPGTLSCRPGVPQGGLSAGLGWKCGQPGRQEPVWPPISWGWGTLSAHPAFPRTGYVASEAGFDRGGMEFVAGHLANRLVCVSARQVWQPWHWGPFSSWVGQAVGGLCLPPDPVRPDPGLQ